MKLLQFKQTIDKNGLITPEKAFEDYNEIISIKRRTNKISEEEFCNQFIEAFKETVLDLWDENKHHIILHSSGYDSRMLSWTIKELGLPNVTYVCMEPEGREFRLVMKHISGRHYCAIMPRIGENPGAFAVSSGLAISRIKADETQVLSSGYFNELLSYGLLNGDKTIKQWIDKYYNSTYAKNAAEFPGDIFFPILGIKVMKVILSSDIKLTLNLHHKIIETMDPVLFGFKRYQD